MQTRSRPHKEVYFEDTDWKSYSVHHLVLELKLISEEEGKKIEKMMFSDDKEIKNLGWNIIDNYFDNYYRNKKKL